MDFEYDPRKNSSNKIKHGIDFEEAKVLWNDKGAVVLTSPYANEPRSLIIGTIGGKHWTAIFTYRTDTVRIISVRRSRKEEVAIYEQKH